MTKLRLLVKLLAPPTIALKFPCDSAAVCLYAVQKRSHSLVTCAHSLRVLQRRDLSTIDQVPTWGPLCWDVLHTRATWERCA